jgi:hypothetical protein
VLLKPLGHLSEVLKQFSRNIGNAHMRTSTPGKKRQIVWRKRKGALERTLSGQMNIGK